MQENYPQSRKELAYAWLDAGFSPGEGAAVEAEKLRAFPDDIPLAAEIREKVLEKESRIYRIYDRIYVYNRRYSMNLPMYSTAVQN